MSDLKLKVCTAGAAPFIFEVYGAATVECLQEIEATMADPDCDLFVEDGSYEVVATHNGEQCGIFGEVEIPAWWEFVIDKYTAFEDNED